MEFKCLAWSVDDIEIKADNGTLKIDWENGYAGVLKTTRSGSSDGQIMGFDSYVISADKSKRDCPAIQLINSSKNSKNVTLSFDIKSENNQIKKRWQEKITLAPNSEKLVFINFPFELKNDVYHLKVKSSGLDKNLDDYKHYIYVKKRKETAGPRKFGLHDCDVRAFGFWPDALPVNISHKYLRWGYVQGPAWVRDWKGNYGQNPDTPPEEWNWDADLDWAVMAGREMFVCLSGYPLSPWQRKHPYPVKMRKYPWGTGGGFPDLERYGYFLREVGKRYKDKVLMWEVENEPNSSFMPKNPEDYAKLSATVNKNIKVHNPKSIIFGISGTSNFVKWMDKVFKAGGWKEFDAISWHTYTTPKQPDDANLPRMLKQAKKCFPKPKLIYNSETGVLLAPRFKVDEALPDAVVAEKVKQKDPKFVSRAAWPGAVNSERQAAGSIVKNATLNFLEGVKAFVFFGWNPDWPKAKTKSHSLSFSILKISNDGERTPTLYMLAVGVLTAQMESLDLNKPYKPVQTFGVRGGIFTKANGGKLGIVWPTTPSSTALITTDKPNLEIVTVFGESKTVKSNSKNNANGKYLYVLKLDKLPVYIHSTGKVLDLLPSPVQKVAESSTGQDKGLITFSLINNLKTGQKLTLSGKASSGVKIVPESRTVEIAPGKRNKVEFNYQRAPGMKENEFYIPFTISLADGSKYEYMVKAKVRPGLTIPKISDKLSSATLNQLKKTGSVLDLDRVEQVVLGRPPELASLQEDFFWGGKDELSAKIYTGSNAKYLLVCVKVHDANPNLPKNWPDVRGASLELFFDFRSSEEGLGRSYYGDKVFQFLVRPAIKAGQKASVWCPQMEDAAKQGIKVTGAPIDKQNYWIGLAIPWKLVSDKGTPLKTIGFDVGINGGYKDKKGRKSQMMMFGTSRNFADPSNFGVATIK